MFWTELGHKTTAPFQSRINQTNKINQKPTGFVLRLQRHWGEDPQFTRRSSLIRNVTMFLINKLTYKSTNHNKPKLESIKTAVWPEKNKTSEKIKGLRKMDCRTLTNHGMMSHRKTNSASGSGEHPKRTRPRRSSSSSRKQHTNLLRSSTAALKRPFGEKLKFHP